MQPNARHRSAGTTLVEHVIAMAVTAVLVGVAYPQYTDHVRRAALREALTTLAGQAQRMETAYDGNGNYGERGCAVAAPTPTDRWTFSCSLQSGGQGFLLTASGGQLVAGQSFTLDQAGHQRTTAFGGAAVDKACWLVRGDEC